MTIDEALTYGRIHLTPTSPTPKLDARLLLQYLLEHPHSYLIAHHQTQLTERQKTTYEQLIARAMAQEPIPYLMGTAPFYGRDFIVNTSVLIPRPETEMLVEMALKWVSTQPTAHIIDVGTGSGCIGVTLAAERPSLTVTAVDVSSSALKVARHNARRFEATQIKFIEGSLLEVTNGPFDLILANLPYVTEHEWTHLDDGVKLYEPMLALKGGEDGLALIKALLRQAKGKLNPNGMILLEIGWQQGQMAQAYAQSCFPQATVSIHQDYAGHDRVIQLAL